DPSEDQIVAALGRIPEDAKVRIHTSLQGRYSIEIAPKILRHLMGRVKDIELVIEPIPENIRRDVYFAPAIRLTHMKDNELPYDVAISYAGEDSEIAQSLAETLRAASLRV